jgi:hypothetical protein
MRAALWGGVAGVAAGMGAVKWVTSHPQLAPVSVMVLWPSSILGFGYNGAGGWAGLLVGTVALGGQALLYGGLGAAVGMLVGSYFKETVE